MKLLVVALAGVSLAGCANSLSQQALGPNAIEVQPTNGNILTPGIYRVVNGSIRPSKVCSDDFDQNKALKINTSTVQSDSTISDDSPGKHASFTLPFGGLLIFGGGSGTVAPVTDTNTVEKYKVTQINQDLGSSTADYMIKNVGSNCRQNYLNGDLLFVDADARAVKYTRVRTGGPSGSVTSGFGNANYTPLQQTTVYNDVTFGVRGEARSIPK
jgi:hypothetical protein